METHEITEVLNRPYSQELLARDVARLALRRQGRHTSHHPDRVRVERLDRRHEVRSLYVGGMVRIVVTPTWAKLIDFETTLPSAVQELVERREQRRQS